MLSIIKANQCSKKKCFVSGHYFSSVYIITGVLMCNYNCIAVVRGGINNKQYIILSSLICSIYTFLWACSVLNNNNKNHHHHLLSVKDAMFPEWRKSKSCLELRLVQVQCWIRVSEPHYPLEVYIWLKNICICAIMIMTTNHDGWIVTI